MYSNGSTPLGPVAATGIIGGTIGWEIFQFWPVDLLNWAFLIAATFTLLSALGAAKDVLPSTYGMQKSLNACIFGAKPLSPKQPAKKRYLRSKSG